MTNCYAVAIMDVCKFIACCMSFCSFTSWCCCFSTCPLCPQGFSGAQLHAERYLNLRYEGTDVAVMTAAPVGPGQSYGDAFSVAYKREFGFALDRPVVVDDVRIRATGRAEPLPAQAHAEHVDPGVPTSLRRCYLAPCTSCMCCWCCKPLSGWLC
jgi:hypothetical protein